MKLSHWFSRPNSVRPNLRVTIASSLVIVATLAFIAIKISKQVSLPATHHAFLFKKGDPDMTPGGSKRARIGPNEYRGADYTPAIEDFLKRAYPASDVPAKASLAAAQGWTALSAGQHSDGAWQLIEITTAKQPGVLNVLGDEAPYIASGRDTAIAVGASCDNHFCPIYLGAAGGGIWRTMHGLDDDPNDWQFLSGSFGTNAIGSILISPNDRSGNTLYVGTGEPDASADSEAGVGIYKSVDGGYTWSLVPGSDIFFQRAIGQMALDNAGNLLVPVASGVRGIDSTDGGATSSGATGHALASRGLYRQNGSTFTQIFVAPAPTRGSTTVVVDPTHAGIIYVSAFGGNFFGPGTSGGVWRSVDNGATFTQIFVPTDSTAFTTEDALERDEFAINTLPSGATRMYVAAGSYTPGGGPAPTFWRSDNADTAATFTSLGGAQVVGYCGTQCWYDDLVYTPQGYPDVVYLGGSFDYGDIVDDGPGFGRTNGRALLLSTNGGALWSDLTQDGKQDHAHYTHPDQHAIVTNPSNPYQYFEGGDGGVVRSDGEFADVSFKCDARGLSVADTAFCKSLLWRVPNRLSNTFNRGLSTLQFQSFSVSEQNPTSKIQGGTQDNGTWSYVSNEEWVQEMYGDGGQSGFSAATDRLRVNTFTDQANDANFHDGDPTKWVIIGSPMGNSPEGSYFYPPVLADPNAGNPQTIYEGSFSVWRTQDWGGNEAFLEANCPEFTTSSTQPGCGDFVPIGPAGATDLTDSGTYGPPVYGSDRTGGAVGVIQRTPANATTLWAATGPGRVFISNNGNAAAGAVLWHRIDPGTNDPSRFPTGIAIDPAKPHHAWISYSGYNVNTPSTPGHVFEVTWSGSGTATWVDRSYNLPDFPITSIVLDDVTGDLYASSDFGVMRLRCGATNWRVAGTGLPMVEVPNLTIVPSVRLLYAATHGRSAWVLRLSDHRDNDDRDDN